MEELYNKILSLPPNKQQAIFWIIENFEFAESICKAGVLTKEQRNFFGSNLNKMMMLCFHCW